LDLHSFPTLRSSELRRIPWAYRLLERKFYVDEAYNQLLIRSYRGLGLLLAGFDRYIVQGAVRIIAAVPLRIGVWARALQNGQFQTYTLVSVIGLVLLIIGLAAGRLFG